MEDLKWWHIGQKKHPEILDILRREAKTRPWCGYFLDDSPFYPGNLNSKCRIGYVPFDDCVLDRFFYVDDSRDPEILASGGITTQIFWDSDPNTLPAGWQGVVLRSCLDSRNADVEPNTLVALLAFTLNRFRGRGLSKAILSKMRLHAKERGYKNLIVPALPPSQFEKANVELSMEELAKLKREDGQPYDFWIRVHVQAGAKVIGYCERSHRFAMCLRDFSEYVSSSPIGSTGEHVVAMDRDRSLGINAKNMWQLVYADIERDFVTFDWGCVWVRYDIA